MGNPPLNLSVPVTSESAQAFEFRIFGRTGFIQEFMELSRSPGHWSISYKVHTARGWVQDYKDPDFPKDFRLMPPSESIK